MRNEADCAVVRRVRTGYTDTMGTTHETTTEFKEMLALLRKTPLGSLPIEHVRPVEEATYRLARQEPCWVPEEDTYPLWGRRFPARSRTS